MKKIIVTPAKLNIAVNSGKYYGVYLKDYPRSSLAMITRDNYSYDRGYRIVTINSITCGNNWDTTNKISKDFPQANLRSFILKLNEAGFEVAEFDTISEFAGWLSHAGETI